MPSRRDLIAELQRVAALPPSSGRHGREGVRPASAASPRGRAGPDRTRAAALGEDRDPNERVDALDWHPNPDSPFAELELCHMVGQRRRWWLALNGDRRR